MRKLKAILGVVLAVAMLCTAFVIPTVASAADVEASGSASQANLQSKVEDGCILQTLGWSYADIEKNIPAIAAAGYTTVQTSPVQQPKDYSPSTNISGQWWKLYQPVSLSLAQRSWIGTPAELTSLCTTAHKYGVKIICDVVTNHLGADDDSGYLKLAKEVQTYDSQLWNGNGMISGNPYFHQNGTGSTANDSNAQGVTQKVSSGCPDLNTSNSTIQTKVTNLLKSCIDCGVDGFRFDAAKHIEVPGDSGVGDTSYWTNVLNGANSYASSKGKTMFYYGEILNTVGGGRSMSNYTNLNGGKFRVTDNLGSNSVRNAVVDNNASGTNLSCNFTGGASKAVVWAESHDTYLNTESGNSTGVSDDDIVKTWALVASRKDATPLFFARTNQAMKMGTFANNTTYKSVAVSEINKFHNKFVGQSEKFGTSGSLAYVARGNEGIVIVNVNGTTASANISGTGLSDGSYKDMITGASFTVSGGTVSGQIGSTGVAVVTKDNPTPYVFADQESQTFQGDYIVVNLTTQNATSATYQLENYTPQSFTGSKKIRIGKDYAYNETINLTLTATNGSETTTTKYTYTKKQAAASGIYIILPKSVADSARWTAPFYCYVYSEPNGKNKYPVYQNSFWPGETMEFDDVKQVYYAEIHADSCVKVINANGDWEVSDYDLAHGADTRVIVSDSAKSAGGISQGNQLPASGSAGFTLDGTSKEYKQLSGRQSNTNFPATTIKPGKTVNETGAVDVSKGNVTPTQPQTQPTQATQPPQTQPTQTTPVGDTKYYGDADLNGTVNINDVTRIQMHLLGLNPITDTTALALADVDADGKVKIQDANYIQRNLVGFSNTGRVKQAYVPVTPTQATQAPQTQPTQAPETQPQPASTYTLYIKTNLTWISSMGAEPFVYDKATGDSYMMVKDLDAYPEVFTAEVPESLSSVCFYRATSELSDPSSGYNVVDNISVSKTNNCIVLTQPSSDLVATVEPYTADVKPADGVSTIYVNNNKGWSEVYIYGWGKGLSDAYLMENIGNNIWKFDLPETIYGDTGDFFLFKGVKDGWDPKTGDLKITNNNNFYDLNAGTWSKY